ncbi:MAG: hypothetical protein GY838_13530 [bacterium]|nr:hypothetical protein [bacterium]
MGTLIDLEATKTLEDAAEANGVEPDGVVVVTEETATVDEASEPTEGDLVKLVEDANDGLLELSELTDAELSALYGEASREDLTREYELTREARADEDRRASLYGVLSRDMSWDGINPSTFCTGDMVVDRRDWDHMHDQPLRTGLIMNSTKHRAFVEWNDGESEWIVYALLNRYQLTNSVSGVSERSYYLNGQRRQRY